MKNRLPRLLISSGVDRLAFTLSSCGPPLAVATVPLMLPTAVSIAVPRTRREQVVVLAHGEAVQLGAELLRCDLDVGAVIAVHDARVSLRDEERLRGGGVARLDRIRNPRERRPGRDPPRRGAEQRAGWSEPRAVRDAPGDRRRVGSAPEGGHRVHGHEAQARPLAC